MTVRLGVAGLGRHGSRYARHLAAGDIAGAELAGVWTRTTSRRDAFAAELKTTGYASVGALARRCDAVVIVVPAGCHRDLAAEVAEAGCGALIEKPIATTVAEAEEITSMFASAQLPLSVSQTLRFDPLTLALRTYAQKQGKLTGFSFEQRLEPRGLAWEDQAELAGGGVFMQTAIHVVDALRFVTGREAEVIYARTAQLGYKNLEDAGWIQLNLLGPEPTPGDVRVSKISKSRHMRYALYFEDGGLEADFIERTLYITRDRERSAIYVASVPTVVAIAQAFVGYLKGGPNPVTPEDATRSLGLIEAAYQRSGA